MEFRTLVSAERKIEQEIGLTKDLSPESVRSSDVIAPVIPVNVELETHLLTRLTLLT